MLTKSDLIYCWHQYAKYNSPHPCRMPSAKAEAGRLLIVYGDKALLVALGQVKPSMWLAEVISYLRQVLTTA